MLSCYHFNVNLGLAFFLVARETVNVPVSEKFRFFHISIILVYIFALLSFQALGGGGGNGWRKGDAVLPLFVIVAILKTLNCFLLRVFGYGSQICRSVFESVATKSLIQTEEELCSVTGSSDDELAASVLIFMSKEDKKKKKAQR